ncbi:MAG: cbb3-type cytochrome c oxidase subunit I, partial [Gemmatimonadota bacterium]
WAMLVTAFMIIFAFTPLIVGTAMLELDRKSVTAFFKPEFGGDPLLWQHLFWIFGHPEVYIMFIPAVGIVSQIVQTFSRRPIVAYPLMVVAIITTGVLSFGLWVHHMFAAGVPAAATSFFTATSTVIAIPAGVQVFSWIATIWLGRPVWRTPLLFVAGFLIIFTLGGVTGVMLAAVPVDQQAHDSFFVVAHFHYVLIGGVVFPLFAGLYYWLPKITGRMLSERLGRWNFWAMFVFFNVTFFPMHIAGLLGMPRRIYTYPSGLGWESYNLISTIGAIGFATAIALFLINVAWSLRKGPPAGYNPWQADTLEWSQESPPAQAQFQMIPAVRSRHPLWEQETLAEIDESRARKLEQFRWRPLDWRGALVVSVSGAAPKYIVHIPTSTIVPFTMAVGFLFVFAAALLDHLLLFAIGMAITLASLIAWFLPQKTERRALEESATDPGSEQLPLAIAGPRANGYWGTIVLILVLVTALFTLVASALYLGLGPHSQRVTYRHDWFLPAMATAALAGGAVQMAWLTQSWHAGRNVRGIARLLITLVAAAAAGRLLVQSFDAADLEPQTVALDSALAALLGFQMLIALILFAMVLGALAWAVMRPSDVRGHAVAWNASLIAYFAAGSSMIVVFTGYVLPRLW